jgi:hypothetical protein
MLLARHDSILQGLEPLPDPGRITHALGWKNGRAKVLAYQADGATKAGPLPTDTTQRWRSLFIDQIEELCITDGKWETADNYSYSRSNCIDELSIAVVPNDLK